MAKFSNQKTTTGFTLIELMAVLAVLAITLSLAVPGMQRTVSNTRLRAEANRLLSALNLARSEAIGRNGLVSVCPSSFASDGVARCSRSYADGWIVFTNRDKDRVVDEGSDEIIRVFSGLPSGYSLTNKAGTIDAYELISYYPDGSSRKNRTLMICPAGAYSAASWSVVMNLVGRPRIAKGWGECL
ncbi:MAG: type IV fimbrial biogenesis protein FimT [Halioglobus sp.]